MDGRIQTMSNDAPQSKLSVSHDQTDSALSAIHSELYNLSPEQWQLAMAETRNPMNDDKWTMITAEELKKLSPKRIDADTNTGTAAMTVYHPSNPPGMPDKPIGKNELGLVTSKTKGADGTDIEIQRHIGNIRNKMDDTYNYLAVPSFLPDGTPEKIDIFYFSNAQGDSSKGPNLI